MLRFFVAILAAVALLLTGCSHGVGNLQSYVNTAAGYEFLYPNGWLKVDIGDSPRVDVVFRDLIDRSETASVAISKAPEGKSLQDVGSPSDVGYGLLKAAIAPPGSEREAELVSAQLGDVKGQTYYKLEYRVKLPSQQERHNLASVALSRDKLYTFNVSVPQDRWEQMEPVFEAMVDSFRVY